MVVDGAVVPRRPDLENVGDTGRRALSYTPAHYAHSQPRRATHNVESDRNAQIRSREIAPVRSRLLH